MFIHFHPGICYLRFLYIFGGSGLLCAAAGLNVGSFGGSREGLFGLCGGVEATTKLIDSDISGCWLLWWTVRRSAFATAKIIYQPWHCNGQCWNKLRSRIFLRTRYREGSQCNTSQVMQKKIMAGKWRWPHWKTSEALEGPDKYVRRAKTIWRLHTLPSVYCCEWYVGLCTRTSNCVLK